MTCLKLLPEEKIIVKNSFELLNSMRKEFRRSFYNHIFDQEPAVRKLFRSSFLDDDLLPDSLVYMRGFLDADPCDVSLIKKMGLKHKTYGVKPLHFPIVRESMLYCLRLYHGEEYDPKIGKAWGKIFDYMAEQLIAGMKRK